MTHEPSTFLRRVLVADAAISGATGLVMLAGASLAARPLGLPAGLLLAAGASLLPFAVGVFWLAARERPPRPGVWLVVALNALWALDALGLLFFGGMAPTALGAAFLIAQGVVTVALAQLEYLGLRCAQGRLVPA